MLFKIFDSATELIFVDTMILDRWLRLRRRLPEIRNNDWLLDARCDSDTFSY